MLAVILAIAAAFLIYTGDYYHADTIANTALISNSSVTVSKLGDDLVFTPAGGASGGLIFYPGGKVEYTAYAPLMHRIAEQGIQCVLVKMPFNLAVLDISAAGGMAESQRSSRRSAAGISADTPSEGPWRQATPPGIPGSFPG